MKTIYNSNDAYPNQLVYHNYRSWVKHRTTNMSCLSPVHITPVRYLPNVSIFFNTVPISLSTSPMMLHHPFLISSDDVFVGDYYSF